MFRSEDANLSRQRFPLQFFRFVDMAFLEELIRQVVFGRVNVSGCSGPRVRNRIASASRDSFSASARRPSAIRGPQGCPWCWRCAGCSGPSTRCSAARTSRYSCSASAKRPCDWMANARLPIASQSSGVIRSQDAALDIEQLAILLFSLGIAALVPERSAQVVHRSQHLRTLRAQSASPEPRSPRAPVSPSSS